MTPEQQLRAQALLSQEELDALAKLGPSASNRLSPAAAAKFFGLFLQGYTPKQIAEQNPNFGSLALGLIVRARIEFDWDGERDKHAQTLMLGARTALEKATLESIQFTADGMAVYHKLVGDRFRKYLQTGDPEVLGSEFKDMSFKNYKDMVATLKSVTGRGEEPARVPRQPLPAAPQDVQGQATVISSVPVLAADAPVSAADAAALLAFMVKANG